MVSEPKADAKTRQERKIEYLSQPAEVSMGDHWFEVSSIQHFWIRRRFDVLQRLAGDFLRGSKEMAEIGCGAGLLQRQVEDAYGREVAGFDLNEHALRQNVTRRSRVFCYDILEQQAELQAKFDLIFLFGVLKHITDEDRFLRALLFHLAPGGRLVVNVPACQWAFSRYDEAAGHRVDAIRSARSEKVLVGTLSYNWSDGPIEGIATISYNLGSKTVVDGANRQEAHHHEWVRFTFRVCQRRPRSAFPMRMDPTGIARYVADGGPAARDAVDPDAGH